MNQSIDDNLRAAIFDPGLQLGPSADAREIVHQQKGAFHGALVDRGASRQVLAGEGFKTVLLDAQGALFTGVLIGTLNGKRRATARLAIEQAGFDGNLDIALRDVPVSYTHLTLPTN